MVETLWKKFSRVIRYTFQQNLLSELIFDLGKCPKKKTWTFTFMHFLVRALPEIQNQFRKQIWLKIGKGVSGHCLIWASGMLPLKFRHILGCLAFSGKKSRHKKDPTLAKLLFENTMGNPFFDFLNTDQNSF